MSSRSAVRLDDPLSFALQGYAWLPALRRRTGRDAVRVSLLGLPAVVLCGPAAGRFCYDEANVRRPDGPGR